MKNSDDHTQVQLQEFNCPAILPVVTRTSVQSFPEYGNTENEHSQPIFIFRVSLCFSIRVKLSLWHLPHLQKKHEKRSLWAMFFFLLLWFRLFVFNICMRNVKKITVSIFFFFLVKKGSNENKSLSQWPFYLILFVRFSYCNKKNEKRSLWAIFFFLV